ncbi:ATP-binding protein [Elusimicrobiota bacterium]
MNFSHIIGNTKYKEHFLNIIEEGVIPHAMLFSGPEGLGKRMFAAALAAALNCESLTRQGACGVCSSCRRLSVGTHPHVKFVGSPKDEKIMEVEFSSQDRILINNIISTGEDNVKKVTKRINIFQIREIIRETSLKAYGSQKKIFILDDIASSSIEALNCLLKILEEPPGDTYFILITSNEKVLLPTIISRCQKFDFSPLLDKEMEEFYNKTADHPLDEERLAGIIKLSSGIPMKMIKYMEIEDVCFPVTSIEDFFEKARNWFSSTQECVDKLKMMIEHEAAKFRESPDDQAYERLMIMETVLNRIRDNANPELAFTNMLMKIGNVRF